MAKLSDLIAATTAKAAPVAADKIPLLDSQTNDDFAHLPFSAFATAAQGAKADTAIQQTAQIVAVSALTKTAYDALTPKVATTLYFITGP